MDEYEQYYLRVKNEIEHRTGTYCSYGRGFMIIYKDPDYKETLCQFNLAALSESYALGSWLLNFQVELITMIKKGYISLKF